jgi:LysR family pca operon transcriptional activator
VLTRSGETFFRHASASVNALREAVASVSPTRQHGQAVVTLGVLPTVAPWLMPQLLQHLDQVAASGGLALSLRIHTDHNPALLTQLRQRELDLVIGRFAEPSHMLGLTFENLYAEPLVLAVRPGHPLLQDAALSAHLLAHLSAFTLVLPLQGTAIRLTADNFFVTRGLSQPPRTVETLAVSVARSYTAHSDAVWLTPVSAAQADLNTGVLSALPVSMNGSEELVGLTLRADATPSDAQHVVLTAIRQLAAARRQQGMT